MKNIEKVTVTTETVEKPIEEREAEKIARALIEDRKWSPLAVARYRPANYSNHTIKTFANSMADIQSEAIDAITAAILSSQSSLRERIKELEEEEAKHVKMLESLADRVVRASARRIADEAKVERLRKAIEVALDEVDGQDYDGAVVILKAALRDTETVG